MGEDLSALIGNPERIRFVTQTFCACMLALGLDGTTLRFILDPTVELCRIAMMQNITAYFYIPEDMIRDYPEIDLLAVSIDPYLINFVYEQTADIVKNIIDWCPKYFEYVEDRVKTVEIMQYAIEHDASLIRFAGKTFDKNYLAKIIVDNQQCIRHVIHQSDKLWMKVLTLDPSTFIHFVNPSRRVCWHAVSVLGINLAYVPLKFRSDDMYMLALTSNNGEYCPKLPNDTKYHSEFDQMLRYATESMKLTHMDMTELGSIINIIGNDNMTDKMKLIAVKRNGMLIKHLYPRTIDLCTEAIRQNPRAIKYIPDTSPELLMEAVKFDGMLIKYVYNQTDVLIDAALKQNPWALKYVRVQKQNHILYAIKHANVKEGDIIYERNDWSEMNEPVGKNNDSTVLKYVRGLTAEHIAAFAKYHPQYITSLPECLLRNRVKTRINRTVSRKYNGTFDGNGVMQIWFDKLAQDTITQRDVIDLYEIKRHELIVLLNDSRYAKRLIHYLLTPCTYYNFGIYDYASEGQLSTLEDDYDEGHPMEMICMVALQSDASVMEDIPSYITTDSFIRKCVTLNGLLIEHVKDQDVDICRVALNQNPAAYEFIRSPTDELKEYARHCTIHQYIKNNAVVYKSLRDRVNNDITTLVLDYVVGS